MRLFNLRLRALLFAAAMVVASVGTASAQTGTFTDGRDGQKYKTVKIGKQTWMAQNLNYKTDNSWCYKNDESNCKQYGRLYDWDTAKTVCPSGWHLPSRQEWNDLIDVAGGDVAAKALKSTRGWNSNGNGTDTYGFSALPAGQGRTGYTFDFDVHYGFWWTATEYGGGHAYGRRMLYNYDDVFEDDYDVDSGFSARCVKD